MPSWLKARSSQREPLVGVAEQAGERWARLVTPSVDLIAPILGIYGGQLLHRSIPRASGWGVAIIAVSMALLVWRLRLAQAGQALDEPQAAAGDRPESGVAARSQTREAEGIAADVLQIVLGLLVNMPLVLNADHWKDFSPTWKLVVVWLLGCTLVVAAVVKLRPQPQRLGLPMLQPLDRRDALALILLVGGALSLRVPFIETIPLGIDPDEASLALSAVDAATGAATDPFATGWATHPTLEFFINGLYIRALGRTVLAMRLPWAVLGSLAVAALYLLARVGYGRRVALLAGMLLTGSNVAIHFGRLGLNNISDCLFMTWVLAALWWAGATGSPAAYALAGGGLGLAQYFYFGNRAIPFVVIAVLAVWLLADWRGVLRSWYLILGGLAVTLAVGGPLFGHWALNPGSITEHLDLTLPFSSHLAEQAAQLHMPLSALWWRQIRDSLLVFIMVPDQGGSYHPGQPMLHALQTPLFLVGLVAILARWRRPFNRGILVWVAVVLILGSVLITDPATFHRLLGVLPAAILIVAIGIDAGIRVLQRAAHWSPSVAKGVTAVLVLVLVTADVYYYFGVYNRTQSYRAPTQEAVSVAALEYEHLRGEGQFVLFTREGVDESGQIYHSQIPYVAGDSFRGGAPQVLNGLDPSRPMYFYVLPDQGAESARLQARFPGGAIQQYYLRGDGQPLMVRYAVGAPQ